MAFNLLNCICSHQLDADLDDIGTSVDEESSDFNNESNIDIEKYDLG